MKGRHEERRRTVVLAEGDKRVFEGEGDVNEARILAEGMVGECLDEDGGGEKELVQRREEVS